MNAQPQRTLKRLLKQFGQELIDDPRRTEALLRDHCGQHTREIFVLVNAQKQHVPNELRTAPSWMPREATYTRLARMLQTKLALTEDAAEWAVAAWADALDLGNASKGEGWTWFPNPLRGPSSSASRKPRGKKRQNSSSGVQYPKDRTRNSSRRAKERAKRAEVGWTFPRLNLAIPAILWRIPVAWANLLPWVALLGATIFLLAVVYWTSSARELPTLGNEVTASGTSIVQSNDASTPVSADTATIPAVAPSTPLPPLPAPAADYLSKVMPLPTWANVNVGDVPLLIRQNPSTVAPHLGVLQDGDPVFIIGFAEDGKWAQISSPYAGWLSLDFLLFQSQDATHTAIQLNVHARRTRGYEVQVRAEPHANAALIATLAPDEYVVVAAQIGQPAIWFQLADPAIGWVAVNDLTPVSP